MMIRQKENLDLTHQKNHLVTPIVIPVAKEEDSNFFKEDDDFGFPNKPKVSTYKPTSIPTVTTPIQPLVKVEKIPTPPPVVLTPKPVVTSPVVMPKVEQPKQEVKEVKIEPQVVVKPPTPQPQVQQQAPAAPVNPTPPPAPVVPQPVVSPKPQPVEVKKEPVIIQPPKKEEPIKENAYIKKPVVEEKSFEEIQKDLSNTNLNFIDDHSSLPYSNKIKSINVDNINPVKIKTSKKNDKNKNKK